jgi:hypothetical protein
MAKTGHGCRTVTESGAAQAYSFSWKVKKAQAMKKVGAALKSGSTINLRPPKGGGVRYIDASGGGLRVCTGEKNSALAKRRKGKVTTWHPVTWWKGLDSGQKFGYGAIGAAVLSIAIWWNLKDKV